MKGHLKIFFLIVVFLVAGVASAQEQKRFGAYIPFDQNVAGAAPQKSFAAGFSAVYLGYIYGPWGVGVPASGKQVYVSSPYDQMIMKWEAGSISPLTNTPTMPGANHFRQNFGFYWGDNYGYVFHRVLDTPQVKTLAALDDWGEYYPNITAITVDPATAAVYFFDFATFDLYRVPNFDGTNTPKLIVSLPFPIYGLAIKGNLIYFGHPGAGDILRMQKNGGPITTYATGMYKPCGLGFDKNGNLYVADYGGDVARVKAGAHTAEYIATGFYTPFYLAVDGMGNVYFTDFEDSALWMLTRKTFVR